MFLHVCTHMCVLCMYMCLCVHVYIYIISVCFTETSLPWSHVSMLILAAGLQDRLVKNTGKQEKPPDRGKKGLSKPARFSGFRGKVPPKEA